jgi:hypothetical protein
VEKTLVIVFDDGEGVWSFGRTGRLEDHGDVTLDELAIIVKHADGRVVFVVVMSARGQTVWKIVWERRIQPYYQRPALAVLVGKVVNAASVTSPLAPSRMARFSGIGMAGDVPR